MHPKNRNQRISSNETIWYDVPELIKEHELAEERLLGTLIIGGGINVDVSNLKPEHFSNQENENTFKAVIETISKGEHLNIVALSKKVRSSRMAKMAINAGIYSEIPNLSEQVITNATLRKMTSAAYETIEGVRRKKDISEVVSIFQEALESVASSAIKKSSDVKSIMQELNKERELINERKMVGFPTWDNLDQLVYGLIVPHIWVVGGYPGTGKTFFMLQLAERIMKHGARIALFSTENSRMRNLLRLIGCNTGIPEMNILKSDLTEEEKELVKQSEQYILEKKLHIFDDVFSTGDIRMKLTALAKKEPIDVVMIDYIQLLNIQDDNYEQMRLVASDLQKISKEMNCAIVAVSQISNEGQRSKNFFRMHFKGAGEIGAIADVAIELKRAEGDFSSLGAIVKKVRHGIPGKLMFKMFSEQNRQNNNYIEESL